MSSILIGNFTVTFQDIVTDNNLKFYSGYDFINLKKELCKEILDKTITSILTYDQLCISVDHIPDFVNLFDINEVILLFKNNYIKIIDNYGIRPVIMQNKSYNNIDYIFSYQNSIEHLEKKFKSIMDKEKMQLMLLYIEKNIKNIGLSKEELMKKNMDELSFDLSNNNLRQHYNLSSTKIDDISKYDVLKINRLNELNLNLIMGKSINVSSTILDGEAKNFINKKISPINFEETFDSIEFTKEIFDIKRIPDLTNLYLKRIIGLQDIIEIRENTNGKKFRELYNTNDYNEDLIRDRIFEHKRKTVGETIVDNLRFYIPNFVGIFNTPTGVGLSLIDKYIIPNIFKDWNPNIFLDNVLKENIDLKIRSNDKKQKREMIKKRFPNVGSNDSCPCESGKKFKKCCGNI